MISQEESSENVTSDEENRLGNEWSKRSLAFMVALKNMKEFVQKISMIDMGEQERYMYRIKMHMWIFCAEKYTLQTHIIYYDKSV